MARDRTALREADALGVSRGPGGAASVRVNHRVENVTGTRRLSGAAASDLPGDNRIVNGPRRNRQAFFDGRPVNVFGTLRDVQNAWREVSEGRARRGSGEPEDAQSGEGPSSKPLDGQTSLARGSRVVENKDGTRTIYSPGGFRVVGGGKLSPNAVITAKSPTGAKEWSNWKKGFFADGMPAGATFQHMDAGGMRYDKDGKPLAVTTEHWGKAKFVKDTVDKIDQMPEEASSLEYSGMLLVEHGSDQGWRSHVIDRLRDVKSQLDEIKEDAEKARWMALDASLGESADSVAMRDWKVDPDAAYKKLHDVPDDFVKRNVGQAVDSLVEGMRQEIDRQFEAGRPEGSRRPGEGPVKHAEDAQDRANAKENGACAAQANGTGTIAQTNDAIDSATQAARTETEASRQRAAETRARTAQFRQERAAKNAADEEFIRQMRARLGQGDVLGGRTSRADWDGGVSPRARRFIESRRAEVSERLSRYRTRPADKGRL